MDWNLFADATFQDVYSLDSDGIWQPEITTSITPLSFEMQQTSKMSTLQHLECWICHECFQNSRSLKRHFTKKHATNNLTKFHCPNCDRSYVHKKHLTYHMRHECGSIAKYNCPYCDRRTKFKASLKRHIKNQHLWTLPVQKQNTSIGFRIIINTGNSRLSAEMSGAAIAVKQIPWIIRKMTQINTKIILYKFYLQ